MAIDHSRVFIGTLSSLSQLQVVREVWYSYLTLLWFYFFPAQLNSWCIRPRARNWLRYC